MTKIVLFVLLAFVFLSASGQEQNNCFSFANNQERQSLLRKLNDTIINPSAKAYLLHNTPINWNSYAWATAYLQDTSAQNYQVLEKAFNQIDKYNPAQRQFIVQTAFACFPTQFVKQMENIASSEKENPKTFASAISYLAMNNIDISSLLDNFNEPENPIIRALRNQYKTEIEYTPIDIKELAELIELNKKQGRKVLYSLQFPDRDKAGIAFVQYADGTFARENGKLVTVDQLARSITNLPPYVTNGNTPAGVHRIKELHSSDNVFIGPTSAFVSYLPFETDAADYFGTPQAEYSLWAYLDFFPNSWKENTMLQQAYWAGKAGRGEIHFHGTTIDPELYKGKAYYPQTPSMGCLCTIELWDNNGCLVRSDQQKLIDLWIATPQIEGYAYILEIKDADMENIKNELEEITK